MQRSRDQISLQIGTGLSKICSHFVLIVTIDFWIPGLHTAHASEAARVAEEVVPHVEEQRVEALHEVLPRMGCLQVSS